MKAGPNEAGPGLPGPSSGQAVSPSGHGAGPALPPKPHPLAARPAPRTGFDADVAIVGGGLSGSVAAVLLGRAGYAVHLVDLHARAPNEFRVEKVVGSQVSALARLGLLDAVASRATLVRQMVSADRGRVVDISSAEHYSLSYRELVEAVRDQIPAGVKVTFDKVTSLRTGPDGQEIALSGGSTIGARLAILASGQSDVLRGQLGIEQRPVLDIRTVSFGFDLSPAPGSSFPVQGLALYGEDPGDGIDYFAALQMESVLRVNLFAFCDHRQDWVASIRREPTRTLHERLPSLRRLLGPYEVTGKVEMFVTRLVRSENVVRDGLVLVGDAFQNSCPAAGLGVTRLLTDVDRLCAYLPGWMSSPGMEASKIAAFYADPEKRRCDQHCIDQAAFRRGFALQPDRRWKVRRQISLFRRRLKAAVLHRAPLPLPLPVAP